MKSNLIRVIVVLVFAVTVLFGYKFYQDSRAWVIMYEVTEGSLLIEAMSSESETHVYTVKTDMADFVGTWDTAEPPPPEIEIVFYDFTSRPGRVVFSLAGEEFDLMEKGIFHVESK